MSSRDSLREKLLDKEEDVGEGRPIVQVLTKLSSRTHEYTAYK